MLRGSSDRYKSLWELTRDIALRALELAACQTAHWKKKKKKERQKKRKEQRVKRGIQRPEGRERERRERRESL